MLSARDIQGRQGLPESAMERKITHDPPLETPHQAFAILNTCKREGRGGKLCSICHSLPLETDAFRHGYRLFHAHLRSLVHNAEMGCPFCLLCLAAIERGSAPDAFNAALAKSDGPPQAHFVWLCGQFFEELLMSTTIDLAELQTHGEQLYVTVGGPTTDRGGNDDDEDSYTRYVPQIGESMSVPMVTGCLYLVTEPATPPAKWLRGKKCSDEIKPSNPDICLLIKEWTQRCIKTHKNCSNQKSDFTPSRLIRIGRKGAASQLVSSRDDSEPYVALSYCWGGNHGLRLTRSNLTALQNFLDESKLNKTCREALEVTRQLGLQYIWIDALCIVQEDLEDWSKESQSMAQIYSNAHVTLLANQGPSSQNGLFPSLTALRELPRIPLRHSHPKDPNANGVAYLCLERAVGRGPAETRAWCLQERKLSARLIVFGPEQLSFHCLEHMTTEQGGRLKPIFSSRPILPGGTDIKRRRLDMLFGWYETVADYSSRQLTNPLDIFAGISGLVRVVGGVPLGRYLAGIWESDLLRGLLWLPSNGGDPSRRPVRTKPTIAPPSGQDVVKRAPSWSWAALQGPVRYVIQRNWEDRIVIDKERRRIDPVHRYPERWTLQSNVGVTQLFMPECKLEVRAVLKQVTISASPAIDYYMKFDCHWRLEYIKIMHLFTAIDGNTEGEIVAAETFDLDEKHSAICTACKLLALLVSKELVGSMDYC